MKKIIIIISFLMSGMCYSQQNFKWEKVDSVAKAKSQIYSDTKMYIGEHWRSAASVIQNDDKDGGIILIKGVASFPKRLSIHTYTFVYDYNITFMFKDNKYKIVIDNVRCSSVRTETGFEYTKLQPFEGENYPDNGVQGYSVKAMKEVMLDLRNHLQYTFDSYNKTISAKSKSDF